MAVRLQIESSATPEVENFLVKALALDGMDVYRSRGFLDLTGLFQVHGLPGFPHLHDSQFVSQLSPDFVKFTNPWPAIRA